MSEQENFKPSRDGKMKEEIEARRKKLSENERKRAFNMTFELLYPLFQEKHSLGDFSPSNILLSRFFLQASSVV